MMAAPAKSLVARKGLSYNRLSNFMKVVAPPAKLYIPVAIAAILLFFSPAYSQRAKDGPLNLIVLGDSISWGQGLKDEHKASYLVKSWLEQQTGREVRELIQAHSGAVIGSAQSTEDEAVRNAAASMSVLGTGWSNQ